MIHDVKFDGEDYKLVILTPITDLDNEGDEWGHCPLTYLLLKKIVKGIGLIIKNQNVLDLIKKGME